MVSVRDGPGIRSECPGHIAGGFMHHAVFRSVVTLCVIALAVAGLSAQRFKPAEGMPDTASAYARLVEPELGAVPAIDCGEGVRVPVHVDGVEVFEDQERFACDNSDFRGGCNVGSRVGRVEGQDRTGAPIPDVVWVYFCRSSGIERFEQGIVSVQMIGHNRQTGATAFFEAPDADPSRPNPQPDLLRLGENGILAGELPGPDDPGFDAAFMPPPIQCSHCHQADPFIHDPWIYGARLPDDPSQPVIPELGGPNSPYFIVGGEDWDRRTVHIEGNGCTACHRAPDPTRYLNPDAYHVNDFMPPHAPGTLAADYAAIRACYDDGPDATPGCDWVEPPAAR
jgi:hypothetical protein